MPIRYVVAEQIGTGQITADVCQWNPVTGDIVHTEYEMHQLLIRECEHLAERRTLQNIRMLEAYGLEQWCDAPTWTKIGQVLDVLAGRMNATTLAHRWQSGVEETQELEEQRRLQQYEHAAVAQVGDEYTYQHNGE